MNATPMRSQSAAAPPNAVSALTAVATPTAPDRPPAPDPAAARRFAELLRQSRDDRAAPALPPTATAEARIANATAQEPSDDSDTAETDAAAVDTTAARAPVPQAATKARAPAGKHATGIAPVDHGRAPSEAAPADGVVADEAAAAQAPTSTGSRADSLALLAAAAAVDSGAAGGRPSADAGALGARVSSGDDAELAPPTSSERTAQRGPVRARGVAIVDVADAAATEVERGAAPREAPVSEAAFRGAMTDAVRAVDAPPARSRALAGDASGLSPVAVVAPRSAGEVQGAAATTSIALATPIDAPGFAAALGVYVSVLAQDGVQHAELHLNPAETGPVSIRISVDGDSARVDFGADLAATRDAIERGLPELASALREAGLTLTGGGVSQHAGSRHGGDEPAPERGRLADAALPRATGTRIAQRVADGGVDLYA